MKRELIAHRDPKSPVSETFRTLRTNIQFMNTNNKLKTLLITSTVQGEGKSWVAANLAITFAQAGKRVVLIDSDMRKGRQYTIFEVSPKPGLSNYLSGIDINTGETTDDDLANYIQETEIPNLYIIPAGNIPPNPSELLVSVKMVRLLDQLKELCDIVIIDGTPCKLVTDSMIISRLVDSTVLVASHKNTKKDDLQKIATNIQNVGGKIAGVVLNKIPISAKKYEQSYYYGSTSSMNNKKIRMPKTTSRQNKVEEMKRRVRPENNQLNRLVSTSSSGQRMQNTNRNIDKTQEAKSLERKINVSDSQDVSLEKTTDILNQINAYLDKEKKNLNNNMKK